jgi:hypothetical protein
MSSNIKIFKLNYSGTFEEISEEIRAKSKINVYLDWEKSLAKLEKTYSTNTRSYFK